MPVQTAQGDLVEVNDADPGDSAPCQSRYAVTSHTTKPDDHDKCVPQFRQPFIFQEHPVPSKLFEYELFVEVTLSCPRCDLRRPFVLLVGNARAHSSAIFCQWRRMVFF